MFVLLILSSVLTLQDTLRACIFQGEILLTWVQACSNAYCEDHLPPDADMIFECPRFLHFGQHHPKQVGARPLQCWSILHAANRWCQIIVPWGPEVGEVSPWTFTFRAPANHHCCLDCGNGQAAKLFKNLASKMV